MPRLIWTPEALRDVERLRRFLAAKNGNAAKRAVATIRQRIKILESHPEAGRPVEEMAAEFREWPIPYGSGGYLALYHYDKKEVVILAVRQGREAGY